jgi:Xaa-Pro aminopeptidase
MVPATDRDSQLAVTLSDHRIIKDAFEIDQLQHAVDYTIKGFEDVVRALPTARQRGERVIEGVFSLRARVEGNDVGYNVIAASGAHATILHWMENNGPVNDGDLLLLDAGVEVNELYTADVTRTMPVNGRFSPAQRRIYEIVRRAADLAIAELRPGIPFITTYQTATRALAEGLIELGILSDELETIIRPDLQLFRRYTLHGTSHMLGLDVHDCTLSRDAHRTGLLAAGHVLTVEPGLYFQPNDLTVPEEYRGIGVRIEDDILITDDGHVNLSAALPRDPDEIEAWMAHLWASGPGDLSR